MIGAARLACLAAVTLPAARAADVERSATSSTAAQQQQQQQRLAVIVPAYRGDLQRAVSSLERWPTICSPVTQRNVDIVLYYAEGEEDADDVNEASETIAQTAGQCFFRTRTVYANLDEQEDFYPKGPSVQFYKMFLDKDVRSQLAEYDALAIVEWDVLVADDSSFEELYKAAFSVGDDFWVKGSNVGGTNFHSTAEVQEMWHVLGHINGNAIYNNNDVAFVEYIEYTRARWEYEYPYDVALWLTISDFPYSWPLWQRYSGRFVTTNLISYVGAEHVDSSSVSDAVAGHTLFIHGSRVDDGNIASRKAASEHTTKRRTDKFSTASSRKRNRDRKRKQRHLRSPEAEDGGAFPGRACTSACGSSGGDDTSELPEGTSTVCDDSCVGSRARFDGFLCGAGDADKYGSMCRLCFTDVEEARGVQRVLAENSNGAMDERVIMCDTMKPPEAVGCSSECHSKSYTVCDNSCGTGRYGDYDCNWKDMGEQCRFCFDDVEAALAADEIARRQGGRVIMCPTMEPPLPPLEADRNELVPEAMSRVDRSRRMQAWRENEKWKTIEKWKIIEKYKVIEKFKEIEKWKYTLVLPEIPEACATEYCPHVSGDGETGRVCDNNCALGTYGTLGCDTRDGIYGFSCRLCYTDQDAALAADDFANNERAIMCETVLPVDIYATRRLGDENPATAPSIGRKLEKLKGMAGGDDEGRLSEIIGAPEAAEGTDFVAPPPVTRPKFPRKLHKLKQEEKIEESKAEVKGAFPGKGCTSACGSSEKGNASGLPEGTSTVCDDSCVGGIEGSDGFLCGAGDANKYGPMCRLCFTDVEEARGVQRTLVENSDGAVDERVIMCDTMKPPEAVECSSECHSKSYTVCDNSCGTGRYGGYDCNWGNMGDTCRFCFDDVEAALAADEIARRDGGRVIMCSTMEPPLQPLETDGNELVPEAMSRVDRSRRMQAWRENEKWKTIEKWKIIEKYKVIEKFKEIEKWKYTLVLPEIPEACATEYCPHVSGDGETGRVCDNNCALGTYGTLGCDTRDGIYGFSCRLCYTDQDAALAADDFANNERAIMCESVLPVDIYATRRLTPAEPASAASIGRKLKDTKERSDVTAVVTVPEDSSDYAENVSEFAELFADLSHRPFVEGVTRGEMCAFIAGREDEVDKWQVTVSSILQFLPGMRVAVAVEGDPKVYQRAIGNFPGVVVRGTSDAYLASLYADKFCGPGTSLIYYAEPDSVISRTFTSKDTHSPNGDLLVVYSEPRSRRAQELSNLANTVLGFKPPSFTQGADLVLPVGANAALRDKVLSVSGGDEIEGARTGEAAVLREIAEVDDIDAIPQMMAALQYSRNSSGLWFFNPQKWVSEHLFKSVSIWEIPLVKPRFACALPASTPLVNSPAEELQRGLEFFSHGGKCENGRIAVETGR